MRAIGNPAVMRELTRVGMQSRTLMEWVLRIMANLLRPDELGPAEAAYKMVAAMVAVAPEPELTRTPVPASKLRHISAATSTHVASASGCSRR